MLCFSALLWAEEAAVQKLMSQVYGQYNAQQQCWLTQYMDQESQDVQDFCMNIAGSEIVTNQEGQTLYLLATGDALDRQENTRIQAHAYLGSAQLLVFKAHQQQWTLVAKSDLIYAGAFGQGLTHWQFLQFGPQAYGYVNQTGDAHQGYAGSHYVLIVYDQVAVKDHWIGASFSNEQSSPDMTQDQLIDLDSRFDIMTDNMLTVGLYPLKITLNGSNAGEQLNNKTYRIPYDIIQGDYQIPANYPLLDIEY